MEPDGKDVKSYRAGQNGRHFEDNIFKSLFVNEKFCVLIRISLKIVPKGPLDHNSALTQVMAWHLTGAKPLSEPMLTQLIDAYRAQRWDE